MSFNLVGYRRRTGYTRQPHGHTTAPVPYTSQSNGAIEAGSRLVRWLCRITMELRMSGRIVKFTPYTTQLYPG